MKLFVAGKQGTARAKYVLLKGVAASARSGRTTPPAWSIALCRVQGISRYGSPVERAASSDRHCPHLDFGPKSYQGQLSGAQGADGQAQDGIRFRVNKAIGTSPAGFDLGPWPHLVYTASPLDRATERRPDAAALRRRPEARACLVGGERVALNREREGSLHALFDFAAAARHGGDVEQAVFLGLHDGAPRFGVPFSAEVGDRLAESGDLILNDLRSLTLEGLLDPGTLDMLAEAKALLHWHASHGFCARCGSPSRMSEAGWRRDCPVCGASHFPRTDPVVIMLVVDGDRCLLGRQARFAPGMWSCLAGFVEPGETLEEAVRRETWEEAGIRTGAVRYLASQPWPFPMSLMIGAVATALTRDITIDADELEAARWFERREVAAMLARTHPEGIFVPAPYAIAHHLARAFVEGRDPPAR